MRHLLLIFLVAFSFQVKSQELFVMTDPASNVPAGSIGVRDMNFFLYEKNGNLNYHNMPEIMWGVNNKLMLRAAAFISNSGEGWDTEGGSLYAKYRFFSVDDMHSHFRMAAYAKYSFNNADIHQDEIETMGHNTGYETGIVATQLINKVAISSSISYERALDNKPNYEFPADQSNSAINYTLSIGKLMHPKKYTSFKQTNINAMVEFLGQRLNGNGKSYLDVVPSVQFIINSQARVDLAYKQELYTSMNRTAPNGFLLRLEYTFFNVTN
ncbi:hypothetical protein [Flavobacterium sp. K5-23]|uniref:hypothetical protein n=1 Tax=Flavobacterium sp. K5-23 TaxID=2746225 RepID=UPI00200C5444|nr:hypothetical protein [Flavobacterium sp. K5-23]UQD55156.1 hypothetical protein FLAK523_01635 [Flavobacterium sp. K5-23]